MRTLERIMYDLDHPPRTVMTAGDKKALAAMQDFGRRLDAGLIRLAPFTIKQIRAGKIPAVSAVPDRDQA